MEKKNNDKSDIWCWCNNHKDFECMKCEEYEMPREDSQLNVCFIHRLSFMMNVLKIYVRKNIQNKK